MNEFDLPCTDCGTTLVERTVPAGRLPVETERVGDVTLAVCTSCRARYYPDTTLATMSSETSIPQPNET